MDPNQNPEDGEKTEEMAPLGGQRTSLSRSPSPANAPTLTRAVRELEPTAIVDDQGNLVGLQFANSFGWPTTNIMATSQTCGGARVFKGNLDKAVWQINTNQCPYYVLSLSSSRHWNLAMAVGMRSVPMTLRFVSSLNWNAKPIRQVGGKNGKDGDIVLIFIPRGVPSFPSGHPPLIINGAPPRLVMEGMLVGRHHAEASEICQFYFE